MNVLSLWKKDILNTECPEATNYELALEIALEKTIRYPTDVRVLNNAPLSFQYNVIKSGEVVISRNENKRIEFHVRTITRYCDFAPPPQELSEGGI